MHFLLRKLTPFELFQRIGKKQFLAEIERKGHEE